MDKNALELMLIRPFKKPNAFKLWERLTDSFAIGEKTIEPLGVEIPAIYVPAKYRRQGIGTILLKEIIRVIETKHPKLPIYLTAMPMLDCPMNSEQLIGWYQKFSFVPIIGDKEAKIMVYDPDNLVQEYLQKELNDAVPSIF